MGEVSRSGEHSGPRQRTVGQIGPRFPTCRSREEFEANLGDVRARIEAAARRSGRNPEDVRLVPVTKTLDERVIGWLRGSGINLVGENKAQEARSKQGVFRSLGLSWAMIGHLQSNKINQVVDTARELHSLDRLDLAEKLDRRLGTLGRTLDVFIQVNSSQEPSKFGLDPTRVAAFAEQVQRFENLNVRGLMTLAVFSDDQIRVRRCFELMESVRESLRANSPDAQHGSELSMGMSGDFELAIEHGATTVRVGQALFGARDLGPDEYWPEEPTPR